MLVGPQHTFKDLAEEIDRAFARWDLSHLHEFEFPDGRRYGIPDDEYGEPAIDYEQARVGAVVRKSEKFRYVFDFGDNRRHSCQVMGSNLNPVEVAGIVPEQPIPIWGWGWIPASMAADGTVTLARMRTSHRRNRESKDRRPGGVGDRRKL